MISFCLYAVGMFVLGLLSPGYLLMQLFVFTYSLGDHIVMPVPDAIAMDLADEGKTGTFLGKYRGYATMGSMAASLLVFIGFRYRGVLVPGGQIDRSVVLRVTCSRCGGVILPVETGEERLRPLMCESMMRKKKDCRLRRNTFLIISLQEFMVSRNGCVWMFAPWIIIELLAMGANTVALLGIAAHFGSSMIAPQIGKFLDRYGVKRDLFWRV